MKKFSALLVIYFLLDDSVSGNRADSSELGPSPRKRVCLPSWTHRGEDQHSFVGEGVGNPIPTTGKKARHSVYSVGRLQHRGRNNVLNKYFGTFISQTGLPKTRKII